MLCRDVIDAKQDDGEDEERSKKEKKGSMSRLIKALLGAFGFDFFMALPMKLVYDVTQFTGPYFLNLFIGYAANFKDNSHALHMGLAVLSCHKSTISGCWLNS